MDAHQPEAAGAFARFGDVESPAVVGNDQLHVFTRLPQPHVGVARPRVCDNVSQGLLGDPIQAQRGVGGDRDVAIALNVTQGYDVRYEQARHARPQGGVLPRALG